MDEKTKVMMLLIDAILSCADDEYKKRMVSFLKLQEKNGSCGDGSFDYKEMSNHNTAVNLAGVFVRHPGTLTNYYE